LIRLAFALLAAAIWLAGLSPAFAERRVALVVGNSAYEHTVKLRNPASDATAMTERLEKLGFEVIGGADLDRRRLVEALIRFGRAAETADVALFFYAGHGLQVNGQNYLVPTDAMVEFEAEIDISLVSLSQIMQQMERGSRTNLVFLDACRDNPFAKELAKSDNRAAVSLSKGLGRVQSGSGTFIAFATQPDAVASDGSGANSPFTTALLRHIERPGQSISDLMIEVRNEVMAETGGKQVPWDSSSLTGRFSFAPEQTLATAGLVQGQGSTVQAGVLPSSAGLEKEAYEQAVAVGSCGAYEAFQRRYPGSFYAELAAERAKAACEAPEQQVASAEPVVAVRSAPKKAGTCQPGPFDVTYCASSVLKSQKGNFYDPDKLFDGNRDTAWVEAEEGDGIGETMTLHFGRQRKLAGFEIINGYDKDQTIWSANSRIRTLDAATATGPAIAVTLQDVRGARQVEFAKPVETSFLELTIRDVYRGQKYRDTAVSELYPIFAD
jgi:hypothetical protein